MFSCHSAGFSLAYPDIYYYIIHTHTQGDLRGKNSTKANAVFSRFEESDFSLKWPKCKGHPCVPMCSTSQVFLVVFSMVLMTGRQTEQQT